MIPFPAFQSSLHSELVTMEIFLSRVLSELGGHFESLTKIHYGEFFHPSIARAMTIKRGGGWGLRGLFDFGVTVRQNDLGSTTSGVQALRVYI